MCCCVGLRWFVVVLLSMIDFGFFVGILLDNVVSSFFWLLFEILVMLMILLLCMVRLMLCRLMLNGFSVFIVSWLMCSKGWLGLWGCNWYLGRLELIIILVRFLVVFCFGLVVLVMCLLCNIVVFLYKVWILLSLWLIYRME